MRQGTRVRTADDERRGVVTDTGCGGELLWVAWEGDTDAVMVEQVETGEWAEVDGDVVVPR